MSASNARKLLVIERRDERWWLLDGMDFTAIAEGTVSATSVLESIQRHEPSALVAIRGPVIQASRAWLDAGVWTGQS